MNKSLWPRLQPHVIAIAIFFVVSCLYCIPALQGLVVEQHDVQGWKGMAQQSFEYKEKYGNFPLWTNSMFSGMPAFQIALESKYNITIAYLHHLFMMFLPTPAGLFFLACVGFYILAVVLRIRPWIGIMGSIGYSFASYSAVIVAVGHTTKFASMGYAPALIAGLILLMQRKYVVGFLTTLIFSTLLFYQNHVQIAYYTFLIAACLGVAYLVQIFKEKDFKHLATALALAVVAVVMGVLSYAVVLFPTYDYSKETMRGGRSELTHAVAADKTSANKTKGGLDKEYAFGWSYGISETLTFIVPRVFGGSNGTVVNNQSYSEFPAETKTGDILIERTGMSDEQAGDFMRPWAYWGDQPGTSGPVYLGAVICVLFVFGLVFYTGWHKWWIIAATIIGIMLAWGKNFSTLNHFLFDYLPFYNKFRAPSMAMVIPQLTFPLLAALGLNQLVTQNFSKEELWKKFKTALYAVAAIALILVAMYFTLDYRGENDTAIRDNLTNGILQQMAQGQQPTDAMQQQANDFGRSITNALKDDRRSMFGSDLVRSLVYIALALGLMYLFVTNKLKATVLLYGLTALVAADLISVDARYLSTKNYVDKDQFESAFTPNRADLQIKQDTGYFRVFDQADAANPYESSRAAYHHNAIGGYHPAKLGLYDDIIKNQLSKGNLQVFNMLNTKYFIMVNPEDRQPVAQQNPGALGPVWFVKTIKYVNNADEEMSALDTFEPADTAIIDKREQPKVTFTPVFDSSATIQLVENLNDKITYTSKANSNQFAVFSEVYYPNGWKAFIDNKPVEIVKVDYVLRGLPVPAGNHTIEFRFEPRAYVIGDTISLIIGITSILLLLGGIWWEWKQYNKQAERRKEVA